VKLRTRKTIVRISGIFIRAQEDEMSRSVWFSFWVLLGIVVSAACSPDLSTPTSGASLPNPASVFCEQNNGIVEFRQDASGGTAGVCVFADGSECDEWAYYRGECHPGDSLPTPEPTETQEPASDGWQTYQDVDLGYSFQYPPDTEIVFDDNPLNSLSIIGTSTENENWPQITISHPSDREEFRPPEDVNLEQWLADHMLLGDERVQDVQIAGVTAIHLRHDRSPQSYAYDRYYFAKAGQLYMLVIGHVADLEDWVLYEHFLNSIQFDE
jgi:putative hemolysin